MSRRSDVARSRAELIYPFYYEMGVGGRKRNLPELRRRLAWIGHKISLVTLRRYSARYEWNRRVAEREGRARDVRAARDDGALAVRRRRDGAPRAAERSAARRRDDADADQPA